MNPPLIVKEYFFPFVQVSADPEHVGRKEPSSIDFETKVAVDKDPEDDTYQVTLEITAMPEDETKRIPYAIHLIAVGMFSVDKNWPDPEKLLRVNGASILYSSAREFLITVTSRGPWAPMILPTISFLPVEENKSKESKPKKKQTTKKTKSTT
jgi:preprotein translocase subunit SecB